jgi:hypothetical protein
MYRGKSNVSTVLRGALPGSGGDAHALRVIRIAANAAVRTLGGIIRLPVILMLPDLYLNSAWKQAGK